MKYLLIPVLFFAVIIQSKAQVQVGDKAPGFTSIDDQGNAWSSDKYYGKKVLVIYFYPAAMTGGCTKQACAFRDDKTSFDELDAMVVGISGDEVENLKYFKLAHDLNFPLLTDEDGGIAKKFGVPIKDGGSIVREIQGSDITLERGVTTSRWTYIIDKSGKVVYKNSEVNAEKDSETTLSIIKNL